MHLTVQNKQAMALTHGFAHGLVQSVLFSIRYAFVCISLLAPICVRQFFRFLEGMKRFCCVNVHA